MAFWAHRKPEANAKWLIEDPVSQQSVQDQPQRLRAHLASVVFRRDGNIPWIATTTLLVASGKDIESYVVDAICEQLEVPNPVALTSSDFDSWLADVRKLVPTLATSVDDSRDAIYAGRGE